MWSSCLNYRHVFSTCPASPRIAPPISVLALTSLLNSWWRITTFSKPSQFLPRACAGAIGRAVFTPHYWSLELLLSIFSTILEKTCLKRKSKWQGQNQNMKTVFWQHHWIPECFCGWSQMFPWTSESHKPVNSLLCFNWSGFVTKQQISTY